MERCFFYLIWSSRSYSFRLFTCLHRRSGAAITTSSLVNNTLYFQTRSSNRTWHKKGHRFGNCRALIFEVSWQLSFPHAFSIFRIYRGSWGQSSSFRFTFNTDVVAYDVAHAKRRLSCSRFQRFGSLGLSEFSFFSLRRRLIELAVSA